MKVALLVQFQSGGQEQESGNWWLAYGDKGDEKIGHWPGSLFTSLSSSAEEIFRGGATSSTLSENGPPMGSGHFAEEDLTKGSTYQRSWYSR
ncbi:hypothetical protein SLEP1_g8632 [Rubroshorea leprosula]|uniref:Neprosin PEP catalytic domain-containing protein n=1 Tax=Rubroshorea leprosula TaxID=152421 RepID=A0AAV5IAN4_9ROSI|nr:hypothetical protein SLEP1_g8632 [Rubroshorea leprosula]